LSSVDAGDARASPISSGELEAHLWLVASRHRGWRPEEEEKEKREKKLYT